MTIDTSAISTMLQDEPESEEFYALIQSAARRLISAVSVLEASIVFEGRHNEIGALGLDRLLRRIGVEIVPFDAEQLIDARIAFRRFGKGRHRAALNFGDCAAYALSQHSGEALLFKGDDFARTDVRNARLEAV